jgi:ABC-type multidrug transport system permease subunit
LIEMLGLDASAEAATDAGTVAIADSDRAAEQIQEPPVDAVGTAGAEDDVHEADEQALEKIGELSTGAVDVADAADHVDSTGSVEDQQALAQFRKLAARPALVKLEVSNAGIGRPVPSGRAQSVPGTMTMMVLMMTLIYGGVFLTMEKGEGMLRRQAMLPLGRMRIFTGKLLGRMLMASLQIVILVLAGRYLFGISWGNSPAGLILVLASYTLAVAGLATLLGAVLRTPAQASSVGWIGSMVLASLGGCWWPSEVMPRWLWSAAHIFPTTWAMDGFHELISFGHGLGEVVLPSVVLLGFGVLFSLLGARYLRFE